MATPEQRAKETKAANTVRREIQKVRLATPETFDDLKDALDKVLEQEAENLGSLQEKVEEECEKGLGLALKRVAQIQEKREKEGFDAERPKAAIEELTSLISAMEAQASALRAAAFLDEEGTWLASEDVGVVRPLIMEAEAELETFFKDSADCIANNAAVMKEPSLPKETRQKWAQLAANVDECAAQAGSTVELAKGVIAEVEERAKEQLLEQVKVEAKERVKKALGVVSTVDAVVREVELEVDVFAKSSKLPESEMLALADKVEVSINAAKETVNSVSLEVDPIDPALAEDTQRRVRAILGAEARRPGIRLGQMRLRLARATNLITRYRDEARDSHNVEVVASLKPKLLEKSNEASGALAALELSIKEAEKEAEPFGKTSGKAGDVETPGDIEEAEKVVNAAKASLASAREALYPIDPSLDEDVKTKLRNFLAPEVKRHEVRVAKMEERIARAASILARHREELHKARLAGLLSDLKPKALEKVKEAVERLETTSEDVKQAEEKVGLFKKYYKMKVSDMLAYADEVTPVIEAAKASVASAISCLRPFDDDVDETVRKELYASIATEAKQPRMRFGQLEKRANRTSNLLKMFVMDTGVKRSAELKQVRKSIQKLIRWIQKRENLVIDDLYRRLDGKGTGSVDKQDFLDFFESADSMLSGGDAALGGEKVDLSRDDFGAVFEDACSDAASMTRDAFMRLVVQHMKVVKATPMTESMTILDCKTLRQLKPGELLEVLDGPEREGKVGVMRVLGRAKVDGLTGWVSMAGNAGSVFLSECEESAAR